jgi:hypothetical protein
MSLILVKNSNLDNLYSRTGAMLSQRLFEIQYRSRRIVIVEYKGHMVRKIHTLKCGAVTYMELRVTCIKQASLFNVPLEYFQNVFL